MEGEERDGGKMKRSGGRKDGEGQERHRWF